MMMLQDLSNMNGFNPQLNGNFVVVLPKNELVEREKRVLSVVFGTIFLYMTVLGITYAYILTTPEERKDFFNKCKEKVNGLFQGRKNETEDDFDDNNNKYDAYSDSFEMIKKENETLKEENKKMKNDQRKNNEIIRSLNKKLEEANELKENLKLKLATSEILSESEKEELKKIINDLCKENEALEKKEKMNERDILLSLENKDKLIREMEIGKWGKEDVFLEHKSVISYPNLSNIK